MRRIPERIRKEIVKRYILWDTVRKISHDFGVGVATVHAIKEEAKREIPDLEELRKHIIWMRKYNITFLDEARAAKLVDALNKLGVNLSDLDKFIKLGEKAFSAGPRSSEEIAQSAIRLIDLEEKTGKPYEEVLEDFEKKTAQSAKLKAEIKRERARKKQLEKEKSQLENIVRKRKKELETVNSRINKSVSTENQLKGISIPKLAKTAKFIPEFEALGFHAEEVQKIAQWKKKLLELGIDPEKLEDFVRRKGPLDAQLSELQRKIKALLDYKYALEKRAWQLWHAESAFSFVTQIHSTGIFYVPCDSCERPLQIRLPTKEQYGKLKHSQFLSALCRHCFTVNVFRPEDIAARVGLIMFPTN